MSFSMEESNLLDRLSDYESRGWLSRQDFYQYRSLMKQHPRNQRSMKKVAGYLDEIANRQHGREVGNDNTSETLLSAASSTDPSSAIDSGDSRSLKLQQDLFQTHEHHVSWDDQNSASESTVSSMKQHQHVEQQLSLPSDPLLMEPSELWKGGRFTGLQLQELFVDMCFFARLGFVQPPCCLKCSYRQAIQPTKTGATKKPIHNNNNQTSICRTWVVWRKHASTLLHPNKINGNIILVQCHVARELLDGKLVEGKYWDAAKKRLLQVAH